MSVLEQSQLTVKVMEIQLGTIETDADKVLEFIEARVEDYAIDKYKGDADSAKKDRAELNKADKRMGEMVSELTDRWMAPLMPTIEKLKKGRTLIKGASGAVDTLVKAKEAQEDEIKRNQITEYWNTRNFDLVPLERIFDPRWLNKGAKLKDIYAEIDAKIKQIYDEIKTIEGVGGEDVVVMKSTYLETLDLGAAIRRGQTLKADRDRIEKEKAARPEREHQEALVEQQEELAHEEIEAQEDAPVATMAQAALGIEPSNPDDDILEYRMALSGEGPEDLLAVLLFMLNSGILITDLTASFSGTRRDMFALRQCMTDNGVVYKKLEASA